MSANQVEHLNQKTHHTTTIIEPIHDSSVRVKLPFKPFSVQTLQKRSKKKHHHRQRDFVNENQLLDEEQIHSI